MVNSLTKNSANTSKFREKEIFFFREARKNWIWRKKDDQTVNYRMFYPDISLF